MSEDGRKLVSFRVTKEKARRLKTKTASEGRTIQDVLEEMVDLYIGKQTSSVRSPSEPSKHESVVGRNGVVREYDIPLDGGSEDAQDPKRQAK